MTLEIDRSGWTRVQFGDVVANVNDNVKDPKQAGIERVIGLEHLDPGELAVTRWGDSIDESTFTKTVKPGQTLFGKRRAYQRKTAYATFAAVCSGDILVFETKDASVLLPQLLPFIASTDDFYARALETSAGSLSPRTRWSDLAEYDFLLPPLQEQQRIAALLWSIEHAVTSARQVVATLARLADLRADELFSLSGRAQMKTCEALCESITVGVVVRPTQYYASVGVPALRSLNVKPNGFVLDDLVHFSVHAHAALTKSTLQLGDVLVVRTGRPGDAAVVDESTSGYNAIDLIISRPGPELLPQYLARFLNSRPGRAATLRTSAGTAQQHFNVGALAKLEIPALPVHEQSEVVSELERLDSAVELARREVQSSAALRNAVLGGIWGVA